MITIVAVGKIKEKYLILGIEDYLKRISKYTQIKIVELEDYSFDKEKTLKTEADKILKTIDLKSFIITLEIDGNNINSKELSELIAKTNISYSDITFIIGSSHGLHNSIKEISNYKLSFSKLTFPHQLFRLILLEQIYRSYKIINNEKYHK